MAQRTVICRHCATPFPASKSGWIYCSPQCFQEWQAERKRIARKEGRVKSRPRKRKSSPEIPCADCGKAFHKSHYKSFRCRPCQNRANEVSARNRAAEVRMQKQQTHILRLGALPAKQCAHCGGRFVPRASNHIRCTLCRRQPKSRKNENNL